MDFVKKNKFLLIYFLFFLIFNVLLYLFIQNFNQTIKFNNLNYKYNAHHYFQDERINGGPFNLLRALGQYDAQWYLKVANSGYPKDPENTNLSDKSEMGSLSYAFFPLYPLLLFLFNKVFANIETSAFILSNILLLVNFISLIYVVGKLFSKQIAYKAVFLLFTFPFAIFFRSYFTEGLQLFLLIWFSYFLVKKRWVKSAIFLSFLTITKGNVILLTILFFYTCFREVKPKSFFKKDMMALLAIVFAPFLLWIAFNYIYTGNPLYFYNIRSEWFKPSFPLLPLLWNFALLFYYPALPFHSFHLSMIDYLSVILILLLLFKSKKLLGYKLWWMSFLLWITPLLVTDTMSYTRYEIVSFPIFIYLAHVLKKISYFIVLGVFLIGLFAASILFVNWYWLG